IVCGGTGLYVRAAIDAYEFPQGDQIENPVRTTYARIAQEQGNLALWQMLKAQDPASAALIHPNNTRRVIRAFELIAEGKCYAQVHAGLSEMKQVVPAVFIGLSCNTALLNQRIDARVDTMIEEGLVDEVKGLLDQGFRAGITAPQAIGYKEIVAALEGELSLDEAIERIKIATHRYGKRQRTWFRKDNRITWLCADSQDTEQLAYRACTELLQ
ncbi:MAG: tRNA (adenosine(37)-N6)-dimethylallyltransferase MiaA, partial [Raoultibacter sp.]